jgi:hypothetical protein
MIEPRLMVRHHRFHLTKRRSAAELGEQQHEELIAGRKATRRLVGPISVDQPVKGRPRNEFEDVVENAIGMAHGVDPFRVQVSRETLETSRINVVRPFKQNSCRTAVRQARP